ncbi:hypothetical protein [uncultured Bacteroides sp.]|uniref:hypothetical protein n=3 Tax=uncultured Bacteroides sp. TaxID=162156 RepID=UPI0027D99663|nr:hypothetical protein [uncultured Bacteroides sp.]
MRTKMFYAIAIAICGTLGMNSCTKDYDDDLRIQRELIESNESNIKAELAAYQTLIDNTIKQMEIAYKNSDEILKQELQAKFDLTKRQLEELSNALNAMKGEIETFKGSYEEFKGKYDEFKGTIELALQTIDVEIDGINARIDDNENKITALDGRMVTAEAAIAELRAWKTLAEGQLAALSTDNEANKTAIGKLKDDINTINSAITALETQYSNLEAAYKAADAALAGRLDDFQTLVTTMQSTLLENITAYKTELKNAFDEHKAAVQDKLNDFGSQLGDVIADVTTLTGKIAGLEGRMGTAESDIAALETQMATVLGYATDITSLRNDLTIAVGRISALETNLATKEAALQVLINANKDAAAANKAEIETLKTEIATLKTNLAEQKTELETAIANAVANKVEQSDIDSAINTLKTDLQGQIDTINGTLTTLGNKDTELGNKLTTLESKVTNIENRIQAIKWVPAFSDGNLTLNATKNSGSTAYDEAKIEEQLYITCKDADIINKIVAPDSEYKVEVVFNKVATSRAIEANPFGVPAVAVASPDNVLQITLAYTDLAALFTAYGTESTPKLTDMQIAIKISNTTTGDMIMSEFAGVMIKNN